MAMPASGYIIDPDAAPYTSNIVLTNGSWGEVLVIDRVLIYGDTRCSFTEARVSTMTLAPLQSTVIAVDWKPGGRGSDLAALRASTARPAR
ncbi:MAG: hypothetical protein JRH20_29380 [Deltaproteobacteria bacterium]|nr:hypothetical protein [Deltaproteobacteria bacterium]